MVRGNKRREFRPKGRQKKVRVYPHAHEMRELRSFHRNDVNREHDLLGGMEEGEGGEEEEGNHTIGGISKTREEAVQYKSWSHPYQQNGDKLA